MGITPLLFGTGAAALGWRRARQSALRGCPPAADLRGAYRLQTLAMARQEPGVAEAFRRLRARRVEPLLVKGWAAARLYPEPGLRPWGDVDLVIRPEQFESAQAALAGQDSLGCPVELHRGFDHGLAHLDGGELEGVFERSQRVELEGVEVRVPSAEDHLRILAVHMLGHGCWRALWLCDIAAAVEGRPAGFDWDLCLGAREPWRDWVACAIGLAHRLLGAEIADTPLVERTRNLPSWLPPAVLRQWEVGDGSSMHGGLTPQALWALRRPGRMLAEMKAHWRNPIQATVELGLPFTERPRLPVQLAAALGRAPAVGRRLAAAYAGAPLARRVNPTPGSK